MIEIKKGGVEDIETVQLLANEIWPVAYSKILSPAQLAFMLNKFYSREALQNQILIFKHQFIIATENSVPVGFASYSAHDAELSVFHLHKLYVANQMQGKNIGKQLLDHLCNEIKNNGATSIQLNVNRYNNAISFYNKHGFSIIREEDNDIGNGYFMNDYVMEKKF